jgi:mannosyltransferase
VVAVFSLWSLEFNYRYPKQDFDGPRAFLHAHSHAGDAIGTSGLAEYPYDKYYGEPWTPIRTAADYAALRRAATRTWVVYSMPEYIDPSLVADLQESCEPQASFIGTLGGGDVKICVTVPPR